MQKLIIGIFLMSALFVPYTVFATPDESADTIVEETDSSDDGAQTALESGIGWQLIRKMEMGSSGKFVNMVLVDQKRYMDKSIYSTAITRLCQNEEEFCRVRFWSQARWVPEKVSMSPAQYKELKADYLFNKAQGMKRLQWACSVDANSLNCLE